MAPSRDDEGFSNGDAGITKSLAETYGWPVENDRGYRILEEPFGAKRRMRVIHIGAGASGICFSKLARDSLENVEVQIYEKNADVGGTWLENRYGFPSLHGIKFTYKTFIQDTPAVPAISLQHASKRFFWKHLGLFVRRRPLILLANSPSREIRNGLSSILDHLKYGDTSAPQLTNTTSWTS